MSDTANREVLEIRLHGRGGQGGVTCAKLLAALHHRLGKNVQSFGDYAGERSGAPVRAYLRVSDRPIRNRNKVYRPDHLLVLDPTLLSENTVAGLAKGGTLLLNTPEAPDVLAGRFPGYHVATVDATAIARRHGIGSHSVVIVNTTIAGAYTAVMGLPLALLEATYEDLGYASNLPAAREAYAAVRTNLPVGGGRGRAVTEPPTHAGKTAYAWTGTPVLPLTEHRLGAPTGLETGSWRTQNPAYVKTPAPCSAVCPAGNDVVGFVQALARHSMAEAAAVLGRTTPLASVCARVCPAPCMQGCNRKLYDGAVNIPGLERWIADHAAVTQSRSTVRTGGEGTPRRFAIVGGGPAGLSAAYALAQAGHRVTIYEGERELGGVLYTGIPAYRLPREVVRREVEGVLRLGVQVRCGEFLDGRALEALATEYDAMVLALGLQKPRPLDLPGALLPGVQQGLRFLRRVNLDGKASLSGHVVVLGGGNTAMDCARSALRSGAARVTVVYRRSQTEMPAIPAEVDEARREGVEFLYMRAPTAFQGGAHVTSVELAAVVLGSPDASGRLRPQITDERHFLACDHVLLALGQIPDLSILPDVWELKLGRCFAQGRPLRVFTAGDISTGEGTVAHAIGDGRLAAARAMRAADGAEPDQAARVAPRAVQPADIRLHHFATAGSAPVSERPARERILDFQEVNQGLQDGREAMRCYSCGDCTHCDTCLVYCPEGVISRSNGGYAVDFTYCKGCGICVTECPRRAMEMVAL